MPQSYKTIKCAALSTSFQKLFLLFCSYSILLTSSAGAQTIGGKRGVQFFTYFSYRFQVPEHQVESIREYLQKKYPGPENPEAAAKKEILTEIYFDNEKQTLLKQNIMLRHWMNISTENRKERIQLLIPPERSQTFGKEVVFRHNRKADIGDKFTTHPLLKLIRNKDRPILDSLLQPLNIQASDLKSALEITEHRELYYLQKDNSDWLALTLTQIRPVDADKAVWELQITPNRKLLTYGAPAVKKELIKETDKLAAALKNAFPELQKQTKTEYTIMQDSLRKTPAKKFSGKIIYIAGFVFLTGILIWLFRYFKQKRGVKA